jgi:hypothetical protein
MGYVILRLFIFRKEKKSSVKNVLSKPVIAVYMRVNDPAKLSTAPYYHEKVILNSFLKYHKKHSNYFTELASKNIEQKILSSKGNKQS